MATPIGKHAKLPESFQHQHGKHAGAINISRNYNQIAVSVVLALLVIAVPFSFNRLLLSIDSSASEGASYTARSFTTDVRPEAAPIESVQVPTDESSDDLMDAVQEVAEVSSVEYTQNVEPQLQKNVMPAGCELISLNMVLQSMGFDTDIVDIVEKHLTIDGHFGKGYSGDPYYSGGGYPQGIVKAANSYLASVDSSLVAHDITGASYELLQAYVAKGYPVLVWTTMNYKDPVFTGAYDEEFEWYLNEHCVVMYGFDGVQVLISDPLEGLVQLDEARFEELFTQCGSMAAVIF